MHGGERRRGVEWRKNDWRKRENQSRYSLHQLRRVMEYIFALFSLLFFFLLLPSPPPRPPLLASRHRRLFFSQWSGRSSFHRALSGTLNRPRAARNENEPQKSFVRASVTFDIPAFFHVVTFFSSSAVRISRAERKKQREKETDFHGLTFA